MIKRKDIFPANRHALYEAHGYSAAIASGDLLFVSGQVGSRPDGSPEPDFATQVRLAFSNLEATLIAGGCTLEDIVDVTTFHTDPENQFETIMPI
ncbi:RidA family protein, partial [Agrobacterium sp. S2]|nr:RidA family protein [Agrobacterium sp. S2]